MREQGKCSRWPESVFTMARIGVHEHQNMQEFMEDQLDADFLSCTEHSNTLYPTQVYHNFFALNQAPY